MRPPVRSLATLAALLFAAALLGQSAAAYACGACFSPVVPAVAGQVQSGQVVLQNAERVFFSRDPKTKRSRVWVEVRYSGAAEDFGWVLPLPQAPTVTVGPKLALDVLDSLTSARYALRPRGRENCRDRRVGCVPPKPHYRYGNADAVAMSDAGSTASDTSSGGGNAPQVTVVNSGQTGPYDYVVVKATSADPLLAWFNTHGYKTPAKALPILQSHLDKGDVFVAIKLSNGKGVNLIRPIILEMPDAEACVPLRLTSIAAANDMNVVVTIAGPARAIPKNHMHVKLNPARIDWFGNAKNAEQVISDAIDEAGGRAFVTESAQPGATLANSLFKGTALSTAAYGMSVNLDEIARVLSQNNSSVWLSAESADIFEKHANITQHMNVKSPTQALALLWTCGRIWSGRAFMAPAGSCPMKAKAAAAIPVPGQQLASELDSEIATPLKQMLASLKASKMVTRLVMRISPDEMDRDPIFAFNPDLPAVWRTRYADVYQVCDDGWYPAMSHRLTIPGVGSWVKKIAVTGIDTRLYDAPAAIAIEVLDESGPAIGVDGTQVELVDTAILGAVPGTPSPAKALSLSKPEAWEPPASDPLVTKVGVWTRINNCEPLPGWVDGELPPASGVPQPQNPKNGIDTNGHGSSVGGDNGNALPTPIPSSPSTSSESSGGCTAGRTSGTTTTGGLAGFALMLSFMTALWLRRRETAGRRG